MPGGRGPPLTLGPEFEQACGGTSWWAGSTNVCDGGVVYRDYVNDDHGSDTGDIGFNGTQNAFGTLAHPAGDKRYPMDKINSVDLVRLELVRRGDTDGDQATGGGAWGDLGVRSAGWDSLVELATGDAETNTIRGSFPLPAHPPGGCKPSPRRPQPERS